MLSLGKRKPVRQLKKAGVIFILFQQRLQVHISGRKDTANPHIIIYVPEIGTLIIKMSKLTTLSI
jgi:hypothetical protein